MGRERKRKKERKKEREKEKEKEKENDWESERESEWESKAMRSINSYVGSAKTAQLPGIPTSVITVIIVIIPLR